MVPNEKRIAAILIGSALALTLCACGGGDAGTTTDTNENNAENTTQAADTAKDEETPKILQAFPLIAMISPSRALPSRKT